MRRPASLLICVALLLTACSHTPKARITEAESRTARAFLSYRHQSPLALRAFLEQFPKGADLHVHLSGAVYAETFIRDAAEDGLCVDPAALKFAKPPCKGKLVLASALSGNMTPPNQDLYDKLIDAFSLRSFVPMPSLSGHDQFFSTFDRISNILS
jgi:adenosine deaminase